MNQSRIDAVRARYGAVDSPYIGSPAVWTSAYVAKEVDLSNFRSDNAYMWQSRHAGERPRITYLAFGAYVASVDRNGLLSLFKEDFSHGCECFTLPFLGSVSRDLLDSVNEVNYLNAALRLSERKTLRVIDLGSGYGRLALRFSEAFPNLSQYYCADAVPESLHVCQAYISEHDLCKVTVIALPDVDAIDFGPGLDLALGVRSLTEMPFSAIEAWMELLSNNRVQNILVIPNEGAEFASREVDGRRIDCRFLMTELGYQLVDSRPVIADDDVRAFTGWDEHFMLYDRL